MKFPMALLLALFVGSMYIDKTSSCPCTKEWDPQCGKNKDGKEVTYGNPCVMKCDGAELIKAGECEKPACKCPKIYNFVCGIRERDLHLINYDNDCLMLCDGATLAFYGDCYNIPCNCKKDLAPVCGEKDGNVREYGNKCAMECDGAKEIPCAID